MTLSHATVTLSFIPGSTRPCHGSSLAYAGLPHTDEHLCDHVVITITLTSTLLSPRPGWNRRWCYHRQVPITLCDNHSIISTSSHSAIWHKPTNYGRIHTSAFSGIKASIHTRFALSHAHGLGILHYQKQHFNFIQGSLPTFQLNATVRGVFMPDSTLDFLPIFSGKKCAKASIFSRFLHSLQWFGPQKLPRYFQA